MARLDEASKEELRDRTIEVLLAARREYLQTPGVNVLKHWDQIQDRLRAAARTSCGPEEWWTALLRSLRVGAASKSSSVSLAALVETVRRLGAAREWLDLLERETGFLMASARLASEQRKEKRAALEAEEEKFNAQFSADKAAKVVV